MPWELVLLEYLKALVTWPVAAVVIVVILRQPLARLIERVVSVKMPGVLLDARQQLETPGEKPVPQTPAPALPAGIHLTPVQQQELVKVFQAERAAARMWEYRYLNHFLAFSTQLVLNWFLTFQVTTEDAYHAYWYQLIPDVNQRKIILQVLAGHLLVEADGPALRMTDKGKEYAAWRGPLPAPATSTPGAPAIAGGAVPG